MVFILLSICLIVLAIVERYVNLKRKDVWDKYKLPLGIGFLLLLFFLSYFVTDTFIGLVNIFVLILPFLNKDFIKDLWDKEKVKTLSHLVGLPLITLLLIGAIRNSLINFRYIYLLLIILNIITRYPNREKATKQETISLIIGGLISLAIIFVLGKGPKADYIVLSRQEIVAKDYVEENYGESDSYVYMTWSNINLRNQDIEVVAFGTNKPSLKLIYKNGEIIDSSPINR